MISGYVAVVGPGKDDPDAESAAMKIGELVAERGGVIVCGGLGGVMEAACRGAKARDGLTVGILPGDDRREANPFVDVTLATGLGEARNTLVVRAADAVVAIGGGFGTLSEIAFALKIGKPVIGLNTWELGRTRGPDGIRRVQDVESAWRLLVELVFERNGVGGR